MAFYSKQTYFQNGNNLKQKQLKINSMKIQRKYYSRGTDIQVQADIVFELKSKPTKCTNKWSDYQRHEALKFLETVKEDIENLIKQIK